MKPPAPKENHQNLPLDDAGTDFFAPRKKLARESGDPKRAHLLGQQEKAIADMALNPNEAPFGDDERRLVTGTMAEALDVFITDRVQLDQEGGEGVKQSEKMFRELGKELFGKPRYGADTATTGIKSLQDRLNKLPADTVFASLRENLRMDLELIDEDGGASKLAKEDPSDLKSRLERTQLLLAQSLSQSCEIVEQMRMDNEMSAAEANKKFEDAFQVMRSLHELQGLIDGLEGKIKDKKHVEAVDAARQKAHSLAGSGEQRPGARAAAKRADSRREAAKVESPQTRSAEEDTQVVGADEKAPVSFSELSKKLSSSDVRMIDDIKEVFGDAEKKVVLNEIMSELQRRVDTAKKLDPSGQKLLEARLPGNVLGINPGHKRAYQFAASVAEGRVVDSERINKMPLRDYVKQYLGVDLRGTKLGKELEERTSFFMSLDA